TRLIVTSSPSGVEMVVPGHSSSAAEVRSDHRSPIMPLAPPRSDKRITARSKTAERIEPPGKTGEEMERSWECLDCTMRSGCSFLRRTHGQSIRYCGLVVQAPEKRRSPPCSNAEQQHTCHRS